MKLPLSFSLLAAGLFSMGCAGLGQYGTMTGQPGAPAAGTPSTTGATPGAAATDPTGTASSTTPSGPSTVSVDIKSSCDKTVKVFFGDKPKFGSGTYSTASSNSRSSHTFKPGEQFWIVDESENGLANVSVAEGTREIEILGSCTALAQR